MMPRDGAGPPAAELQRALLNILEDLTGEQAHLQAGQRAMLNILEDTGAETANLQLTQRAVLNILEDFEKEKSKVESLNLDLREQIRERQRAQEEVKKLNRELEQRVQDRTLDLAASHQELAQFSYSASHDIRAPLRAIDGYCQVLFEDYGASLDAAGRDLLSRVRQASQHMDQIIDGVLVLSRAARSEIRWTAVDLSAEARRIARELRRSAPRRRAAFVIASGLQAGGDRKLLCIVLENLLANAWKFTGKHARARIEVGAIQEADGPVFFVRDDGAGFAMSYAGKLFGAFQRMHPGSEFGGVGIGLATVQRIIQRHGGRVWAESAPEQGATFFFTLPGKVMP